MFVNTKIKHLAIIPDGNRRCAKRLLKQPWRGHEWGIQKLREVFDWCKELGIKIVTFYALSLENINKRPKKELDFLYKLMKVEIKKILEKTSFIHKNKVKIKVFGHLEKIPKDLQTNIKRLESDTKKYNNFQLNFAVAYSGREEIVDACKKIALSVKNGKISPEKINDSLLKHNLYTNGLPDPDLVLRTSEQRLSGFLLWQVAYSEIAFTDTYWPELTKKEFFNIIKDFENRDRRFGK